MLKRLVLAVVAAAWGGEATADAAQFLTSYQWDNSNKDFGGYSGIEISDDGSSFVILSDRAHLIEGRILRQGDRILGVVSSPISPLKFDDAILGEDPPRDSEGLVRSDNGTTYISFESNNVVLAFRPNGVVRRLPKHPDFDGFQNNGGAEALAQSPTGELCLTPERSGTLITPFPLYCYDGTDWEIAARIPRNGGFCPQGRISMILDGFIFLNVHLTGLDFDPVYADSLSTKVG